MGESTGSHKIANFMGESKDPQGVILKIFSTIFQNDAILLDKKSGGVTIN